MARKRKYRNDIAETLIPDSRNTSDNTRGEEEEEEVFNDDEEEEEAVKGFFACYLLCSLSPRFKGHTYIGFTVNPRRRIRQHNGEITSGAWRTKRKRPWEMVLCVYGFPTNVSALQFEWAWQHPTESLAVRKAAATLKSLSGIANKIKLVYLMLTLPPWQSLKLTVNFFSTKYTTHSVGCPNLPKQMKVKVGPIDELPCYAEGNRLLDENDEDDHFEGDENDSGHHPDIPLYNISKTIAHAQLRGNAGDHERQLFYHADSPVRIPVLSTMRLGGTATTIEGADSVSFSEEKISGDSRQATKSQMATSTLTKFDQNPPTGNHNFTSEFGFELQNGKEDHRAQFSSIDSLVQEPCDSITSFVNTVETDKCRNSLGLFKDTGKVSQPMKQKLTTEASATVEKQSQVAVSTYFSSETGSRLQHDEPFILREEDHRETFDITDSPPSSSCITMPNEVTTLEDKIPCRLFQGNTHKHDESFILREEDHRETFDITDSPPSSSCITMPNEVTTLEDKIPCRLFQGNTRKAGRARAKLKATVLKDDDEQPLSSNSLLSPGVEVINVLTPSSECTMPLFRRKKRASLVNRHEIIDLTNSPGCIQL